MNLKETIKIARLLDIYGGLLTKKQQQILNSYINFNGSISEIAENTKTSRQAVLDIIKRTLQKLNQLEEKLKICKKLDNIYEKICKISAQFGLTTKQEQAIIEAVKEMEE